MSSCMAAATQLRGSRHPDRRTGWRLRIDVSSPRCRIAPCRQNADGCPFGLTGAPSADSNPPAAQLTGHPRRMLCRLQTPAPPQATSTNKFKQYARPTRDKIRHALCFFASARHQPFPHTADWLLRKYRRTATGFPEQLRHANDNKQHRKLSIPFFLSLQFLRLAATASHSSILRRVFVTGSFSVISSSSLPESRCRVHHLLFEGRTTGFSWNLALERVRQLLQFLVPPVPSASRAAADCIVQRRHSGLFLLGRRCGGRFPAVRRRPLARQSRNALYEPIKSVR